MTPMRYCYIVQRYSGCPVHEGVDAPTLRFASKLANILHEAAYDMNEYEFDEVYTTDGELVGDFYTEFSNHRVTGLSFRKEGDISLSFTLKDDGSGNKRWEDHIGNIVNPNDTLIEGEGFSFIEVSNKF